MPEQHHYFTGGILQVVKVLRDCHRCRQNDLSSNINQFEAKSAPSHR